MRLCKEWQIYADDITVRTGRVIEGVLYTDEEHAARKAAARERVTDAYRAQRVQDLEEAFKALGFSASGFGDEDKCKGPRKVTKGEKAAKAAADKAAAEKAAAAAAAAKAPMAVTVEPVAGSGAPGCEATECYTPSTVTIAAGGTVTFTNTDTAPHTSTSGSAADGPDGIFDTSLIMMNASFDVTLSDAGTYTYFCMVHPWMEGTIIVE